MERNAHYTAVGAATLALLIALAVFVVWLARFQFDEDYDTYDILFTGPVRGLSEGGEVHFNGIRVGEVTDLRLDRETGNTVIASVRLDAGIPVRVDSRAQLEPLGITGLNYIQITAGRPGGPLLREQFPDGVTPVIQSQPSPISELLEGSGNVLAQAVDALNRVNRVLSDENIRSFSETLNNVETVSAELEARREILGQLEEALVNANSAIREYEALAVSTRGVIEGDGAQAVERISAAASEIEAAASDVRTMVNQLNGPVDDFANTGLPQLTSAIGALEEATDSLNALVRDARASPQQLIGRAPAEEIEVEP